MVLRKKGTWKNPIVYVINLENCSITEIQISESASIASYIIYLALTFIGKTIGICAATYFTAATWSFTSTEPNLRWISCKIFRPWNPLPLPSNRAMMMLSVWTSTESQSMWNLSVTSWPPGSSSLQYQHWTKTRAIANLVGILAFTLIS